VSKKIPPDGKNSPLKSPPGCGFFKYRIFLPLNLRPEAGFQSEEEIPQYPFLDRTGFPPPFFQKPVTEGISLADESNKKGLAQILLAQKIGRCS
jgi:hypothetical protein